MKLRLERINLSSTYTLGKLYIDDVYFCDTLEDTYRDLSKESKVYGETAIPYGMYKVILSRSNKFKKILPLLLNVPHFEGIRIHNGNYPKDTEGCILVGTNGANGIVSNSIKTMEKLMDKLMCSEEEITIEITNK